jgi:hypothetical protein
MREITQCRYERDGKEVHKSIENFQQKAYDGYTKNNRVFKLHFGQAHHKEMEGKFSGEAK